MVAPHVDVDPFAAGERALDEPDPGGEAMRAAGPIVRVDAPAGGPVWIITEDALARAVLVDPRVVKDPAFAPAGWDEPDRGPGADRRPAAVADHLRRPRARPAAPGARPAVRGPPDARALPAAGRDRARAALRARRRRSSRST